ncbi:MAG: LuxR family transcriptional regulator [Microcoleus sp. PH2017_29_MFU_D_A]|jgi:DNA-binding CsgD family transcriptional regulator|uniref:LuxR C-terminal-related transcriptional regulator n=1 Tax=unclassified Microcoleus TaxID=2642155 RepID=UPI001DF7A51E|nr:MULTISPECIES: LuxR C-terminal-related transcriptional regulator [unclassified Microcoleus]MCC3420780.1 LuxR family transcriptional regulator [Microcoleus sp. PH2017_07_MST_O_A]MCC3430508.1 LuxR family transcriptional regulator [Microcoleus sp. PH2017_04_SCI_O_A]MCC3444268.1 LuxR family transcriptional regulator [Microcoleus sp. PH2017_03_ELD_O_A]MCC3468048.1 LuxR family transcriptional regulator [Microcoleus sp. PH2017_06_SFM_O_A]MCC3507111.1 LuxR family transcriptional regulator [Microcole
MTNSLQHLFEAINQVKNEQDLRSQVVPQIGEYFAAKRSGVFFFDQLPLLDKKFHKTLEIALSIEYNPIARYLVERHAPVHEALVASPKVWTMICPRPDHWHVMAGPIVSCGQLVGVFGCTREQSMSAFDAQNLADLSGICLHLSVWSATMRSPYQPFKTNRLTPRELEIAELVALGRTNAEIGTELWITENSVKQALKRMFRKLEVSSRAQMVAQLSATKYEPSVKQSVSNLVLNGDR